LNKKKAGVDNKVVPMFSHLPAYSKLATAELGKSKNRVHPLVVQLGLRYADRIISGGNSRTLALLTVFKKVVQEYQPPEGVEFKQVFLTFLNNQIDFLFKCRPKSIGMGTAISFIKSKIRALDNNITAEQARMWLEEAIEHFEE